jgi:dipeptidyl aminopeptidase/acylaminoacyl peptidase
MIDNVRTIQPEDLFKLRFLQDAKLSSDGKTVAYSTSWVDSEDKEHEAIWLHTLESGETRQLTSGEAKDSNPRWSPDGKEIAFTSNRNEKNQIYTIPVHRGEAKPLTSMSQGVSGAVEWSPDGSLIAFTAGPQEEPRDPSKPYRVDRHIYRFNGMGYLDDVVNDIYVVSAKGGEEKRLTDDEYNNGNPRWSPDGREIMFLAGMFPGSHRSMSGIKTVDLDGNGQEIVIDWGYASAAEWLPNGEEIVFIGNHIDVLGGTHNRLWVIESNGGEPNCRSASLELQIGGGLQGDMPVTASWGVPRISVSEDGCECYVDVQDGGTVQIYRMSLSGPDNWEPVLSGERRCNLLDGNAGNLLYAVSTLNVPSNLYLAEVDGEKELCLTRLNEEALSEITLPGFKQLSYNSVDGETIEGWIITPTVGEPPYPTILYIHGGPHSAFGYVFSFDFQMLAGAGYAVLFVNHRASTGYGDEFSTKIIGDWGNLDYEDLMAGVDYVIEKGIADPERLGCCGLSGGGNLSCWIVGHTDRFKAAVPENPVTNFHSMYGVSDIGPWFVVRELGGLPHEIPEVYTRCSPITYAHKCTTPTLLIQGEADYRCPAEQSEQFYAVLKANGCIVEMLRLPDSSHVGSIMGPPYIRRAQNEALIDWMNKYVLGSK